MKVVLDRTFPMPAGAEATWRALSDIEAVASCMPGANITERVDDRHYKGTVKLKVGPAVMTFRGEIEVKDQDVATRTLRLVAKGTDTSGSSAASLDLTARVDPLDGDRSNLAGHSEASVSGKAATFGGRLMDAVADQLIKQFAANFAARVEAQKPSPAAIGNASEPLRETDASSTSSALSASAGTAPATSTSASPSAVPDPKARSESSSRAATSDRAPMASSAPQTKPLNAFALVWAVIRDWLRGLFSKKTA
jgi:uncharacterized protein